MWRFVFPVLVLSALFILVPLVSMTSPTQASAESPELSAPGERLDVDSLRARTRNRPLRLAGDEEMSYLRGATLADLVSDLLVGTERERRLAASLLGISGHPDAIAALVRAFDREGEPRALASLALALAESRRGAAIEALIFAIRQRQGLPAYEACRALKITYGINLGLDADAWQRWFTVSRAAQD